MKISSDREKTLAVVCHDAGGACQIAAQLSRAEYDKVNCRILTEGPATAIFHEAFSNRNFAQSIPDALSGVQLLITGTGWASNLEHHARGAAKRSGIYSIAVLDHWTNYAERFVRDGEKVLPDEIWVVDEYAWRLAKEIFPSLKITLRHDYYADQQARRIAPLSETVKGELLYLLEPMRSDWGRGELGEFQALRYFLEHLPRLALPADTVIRLRPHPSEPPGKYDVFLAAPSHHQALLDTGGLTEALSRARWVVGCQTYAMTLALKADRKVYCSLPPWAPACKLPHKGLIYIKELGRA